jgi:hypothetical protein
LVLHPGSIDEVPQCDPKVNLAQVDHPQIPVTEIEGPVVSSLEAIQLPRRDWYRNVG